MKKYDVVVVGAGPAGSLLGYLLARRGVDVLILERKKLPKYKACGGGLTRRAFDLLPFHIDAVTELYKKLTDVHSIVSALVQATAHREISTVRED